MLVQSKQIQKLIAGYMPVNNLAFPTGSSMNVSAALTSAAATAGFGATPVPVQVGSITSTGGNEGFIVSGKNVCQVYDSEGQKMADSSGNEVYGRLSVVSGAYTLSLFSNLNNVETAFVMSAPTTISFSPSYIYSFAHLPADFATSLAEAYQGNDPKDLAPIVSQMVSQLLPISTINTLPVLTYNYTPGEEFFLFVNGEAANALGPTPAFNVVGKNITWYAANAGYSLTSSDEVVAFYGTQDLTANLGMLEELVPVLSVNTLGALSTPYAGGSVFLFINGKAISNITTPPKFSVSGTTITWIAANAGYNLSPSDQVVAYYAI